MLLKLPEYFLHQVRYGTKMINELKRMLEAAEDLTIKIRFALEHKEEARAAGENVDRWDRQIKQWEKELDALNEKILALWKENLG